MEFIAIDIESCTGRNDDGSLCSFGYAIFDEKFNLIDKKDILINPIPKRFLVGDDKHYNKTGVEFSYSIQSFRNSPKFCDKYDEIRSVIDERIVLLFANGNDIRYLNNACDKYNKKRIEYKFLDVQFIFQLLYPLETSLGLKKLADKFNVSFLEHRSDEDAFATAKILQGILKENSLTFNELIEKYGISYGENKEFGYKNSYSTALFNGEFNLKRSRRLQTIIFNDYLDNLPKIKTNKVVCFSSKIEKEDVNFLRTLINLAYKNDIRFVQDINQSNIFVSDGNPKEDKKFQSLKIKSKNITYLTLNDFKTFVGYKKDEIFKDAKLLKNYFSVYQK